MEQAFGDASVADNDWLGTAALDNPAHQPLEEIVGLDPTDGHRRTRLCTAGPGRAGSPFSPPGARWWTTRAATRRWPSRPDGALPVTRFVMPAATGIELLRRFSRWSIPAQRPVGGEAVRLNVEDTAELPYPESRYGL